MIYLIGGPGRVGKTTLAKKVLAEKGIPFLPTDMVFDTLMNVAPQLGIATDLNQRAEKFAPYLKELIRTANNLHPEMGDYLIEGVDITPLIISEIKDILLKPVFLGFSAITLERLLATGGETNWLKNLPEPDQHKFVAQIITVSNYLEKDCAKYGYKYFDLSSDFQEQLQTASDFLCQN